MLAKLSWQEPESLVGWLCLISWRPSYIDIGTIDEYCLIDKDTEVIYKGTWGSTEEGAIKGLNMQGSIPIRKDIIVSISPIKQIF